jgi:hypothetical protein
VVGEQPAEAAPQPVGQPLRRPVLVGTQQRLQCRVGVLDEQPAAGSQRADHGRQRGGTVWHVHQGQPSVHQVVRPVRRLVGADVMLAHLVARGGRQPARVDVGGQHMTARTDPCGEPVRDPGAAGTDLPTPPARLDTQRLDVPVGHRVEERCQRVEPAGGLRLPVVEQVAVLWRHGRILPDRFVKTA